MLVELLITSGAVRVRSSDFVFVADTGPSGCRREEEIEAEE